MHYRRHAVQPQKVDLDFQFMKHSQFKCTKVTMVYLLITLFMNFWVGLWWEWYTVFWSHHSCWKQIQHVTRGGCCKINMLPVLKNIILFKYHLKLDRNIAKQEKIFLGVGLVGCQLNWWWGTLTSCWGGLTPIISEVRREFVFFIVASKHIFEGWGHSSPLLIWHFVVLKIDSV